ncbi:KdsC family phosphatase [Leptospira noguchii]|uniref:3-deoxy-D-manno-octulosonate 8-phosphate phosphatase KdsC n=1 Tax=Leptospira noguchii serovar Panama str. CZ214 TaxID=1001595 RepID=T0F9I4_9LEPT|nr:HAD hydrolase family protein [Leptospira noguchii]EQA69858.1 putative 3-deoxy-manno-octulosonate-8-phosphatase [Leptospira noguchii serovar Panama str. CZ214]
MKKLLKRIFRIRFRNEDILKNLKLVIIDIDGVLTDGKLYYNESGEFFKIFDVKDGLGIKLLHQEATVAFLSGNPSEIIATRARALGIEHCYIGIENKKESLLSLMYQLKVSKDEVAYIGDDLNDLSVKQLVKLFVCPSDAHLLVKNKSDLILKSAGGNGAVREFADLVLEAKGKFHDYANGIAKSNV